MIITKTIVDMINISALVADLYIYLFLPLIICAVYIVFLIAILKNNRQNIRNKRMIMLNKIAWLASLASFLTFFSVMISTNIFKQINPYLFHLLFSIWIYVSLFCLAELIIKLFYQYQNKSIPTRWYQLGIWWYGLGLIANLSVWIIK